jgi:S-adenosylmethionine:tRNA-ribosyltransferase-isomerase (queuine synthetase)
MMLTDVELLRDDDAEVTVNRTVYAQSGLSAKAPTANFEGSLLLDIHGSTINNEPLTLNIDQSYNKPRVEKLSRSQAEVQAMEVKSKLLSVVICLTGPPKIFTEGTSIFRIVTDAAD